MSLDVDIYNTLKPLVGNRVAEDEFPQPPAEPTWPAIRVTFVDVVPTIDACGAGGDETSVSNVQIDVVAKEANQRRTLRLQVMAAMQTFYPPAILQQWFNLRDSETKTYRTLMQYAFYPSTTSGSP